jgi:adenosine deaminase
MTDIARFVRDLPKTELHIHIEGTLEPEMMFQMAMRNAVQLRFATVEDVRKAYEFTDLQSFLDIYYEGAGVLTTEQDFTELAMAYLQKAASQGVRHAEIFFDPQTHTERGIEFGTVVRGLRSACERAKEELGVSGELIMCFLRHLSEDSAMKMLDAAEAFEGWIMGVGLDSGEKGNPPSKFKNAFERAKKIGFLPVAHAGEEGDPSYIWEAIDVLGVKRVDHGVRCVEDPKLVRRLAADRIPLTVCPLSNVKLKVFKKLEDHVLPELLDSGVCATINSDDPAYFGGYVADNYLAVHQALGFGETELRQIARNGVTASFLEEALKQDLLSQVDAFA